MADTMLKQLLKELATLNAEDRAALADVLSNRTPEKVDKRDSKLDCDTEHVWSDERRDHNGKRVNRSCTVCGVLALHTGERNGKLEEVSEEADDGLGGAAPAEPDAVSAAPAATSKPKRKSA